ncbi:MAG: hypothetical protein U1C71_02360, partial [archaeon]|nr:hypothetical protein [archaeon]
MEPNIPPLAPGETILHEIKTSPRTITYYSILASPLMGVWFIGLLIFLLHTYRTNAGNWKIFL